MEQQELPNVKKPKFLRFVIPVIETLKELGGSGGPAEVQDGIIRRYIIPQSELEALNKNGESKIKNQIAWARFYLSKAGIIGTSERGVWSLTEEGMKSRFTPEEVFLLFKNVHAVWGVSKYDKERQEETEDEVVDENEPETILNYKEQLILILRDKLSPAGFERLSQRLLRESGFTKVEVTGRKGDGGITTAYFLIIDN